MSLFDVNEIGTKKISNYLSPSGLKMSVKSQMVIGKSLKQLEQTIGEVEHDMIYQFCTGGQWSMHQMLNYLLIRTGPAKIWLTTWTITELPMRALLGMIKEGLITELNAVLDYRIEKRKPEAFQLASNLITRIKLTKCHAKVLVIQNDNWNIAVVTTSNFSKNPRIEAGVIFTDLASAEFHKNWIDGVIDGKEVFRAG
ncbi:hypothetical protein [Mongoliibacter ruber]|uniref:Phospholipase D-like protein n=1 Tax=Mongoliibacter ruber TaxID=1750599 RepID=A0A2T0WV75_9BACT|nr:hypothetical protein [Mongoliibacter ruber]PRY90580.1 hypothetical protein CLW00_101243 [Mongoliibacter ruber]